MFREISLIAAIIVLGFLLGNTPVMGQSKEEGINLFNGAKALQYNTQSGKDLKKAVEKYEQALRIFEAVKFDEGIGWVANNLGNVYLDWGRYDRAVDYYEKSLAIKREMKDRKGEGLTLNNLGLVYADWDQYDKAVEYYEKSLTIAQELKDRSGEAKSLVCLGFVYWNLGQNGKAVSEDALFVSAQGFGNILEYADA